MTNGLVVMTPTTVDKTGASSTATVNSDGSVTFGSCETLSLNGVFTSNYDNYMVIYKGYGSASVAMYYRLRLSEVDNSTANSYVTQDLYATGTTITGYRLTASYAQTGGLHSSSTSGNALYLFGPYLAQPTAARSTGIFAGSGAWTIDRASTHNQSVAYDGITFFPDIGSATGLVTVFGFNQ